ncbi:MAG: leucyl aminopeptidase [candidate division Zixibacteria bacterium]|nr:leucyl aminopeptidase [candidate division Zixibacteria bacterium]
MNLKYTAEHPANCDADSLVIFTTEYEKISDKTLRELNVTSGGAVETLLDSGQFKGREGQIATIMHPAGYSTKRAILVGIGDHRKVDADSYRRASGRLSKDPGLKNSSSASFYFGKAEDATFYQGAIEGYILGGFKQREFKTGDNAEDDSKLKTVNFVIDNKRLLKRLEKAVTRGRIMAEGQCLVRRLANTPSNHLTPAKLATLAKKLAKANGLECTILDQKKIEAQKMGAVLSVAKGSVEPPKFIILKYSGGHPGQKPVVLVGKGVTFDAGGISLKPPLLMHEMRGDMAGAATVLAAIVAAAQLELRLNVVALMPAVENLPSGTATKPGDVITSRKGLTIEVINTDAEGRLILADGLDFANTFEPQAVLDIATLTGAAQYILGYAGAPVLGNNDKLLQRVINASVATAEPVWELPIWDYHRDQMKSSLADMVNSAGKYAGTITATVFLEKFVGDWPWVHIDIASVDQEPKGRPYMPKGTTGFGLRLMVELLSNWKKL